MTEPDRSFGIDRRAWLVIGAAVVTVAAAGFMGGAHPYRPPPAPGIEPVASGSAANAPVPSYGDLAGSRRGPNEGMYVAAFDQLAPGLLPAPERPATEDERRATIEARRARRAFDGAPPQIPHAIDQQRFPSCLTCHESGALLAGRRAPVMSHQRMDNCVQCHVVAEAPKPLALDAPPPNDFVGLETSGSGPRAWAGAPPQIPHTTFMRENCASCHGPGGAHGIRTSHPYRQSCNQCHASSATKDQRASSEAPPPWEVNKP